MYLKYTSLTVKLLLSQQIHVCKYFLSVLLVDAGLCIETPIGVLIFMYIETLNIVIHWIVLCLGNKYLTYVYITTNWLIAMMKILNKMKIKTHNHFIYTTVYINKRSVFKLETNLCDKASKKDFFGKPFSYLERLNCKYFTMYLEVNKF